MANNTIYPYGPGGQLPSGIAIADDLNTNRADMALSAKQGKVLGEVIYGSTRVPVDFSSLTKYAIYIDGNTGEWADSAGTEFVFIPVQPGEIYQIVASEMKVTVYTVLKNDSHVTGETPSYATGYTSTIIVLAGATSDDVIVPSDGHYILLFLKSNSTGATDAKLFKLSGETSGGLIRRVEELERKEDEGGSADDNAVANLLASFGNTLKKLHYELNEDGEEIPETLQVLNMQRKARQFTDIVWTTKGSVPKALGGNWSAGTTITGLPYSSVAELDKYIGIDVSLHTFMTAVNNPYSLLYTENVNGSRSQSAWGKTYHGNGSVGSYFGAVCTELTAVCTGHKMVWFSFEYKWLAKYAFRAIKLYNQSAQGLCLGDIVWKEGHCRLVIGLKRDSGGNVTNVKISEQVEPKAQENQYITASAFNAQLASENGIIYRSLELYKNIDYVPSPYVPVMGEPTQMVTYNNDICCFAGDKATFREGDTIAVNYNLETVGSWTSMQLYKNDTLVDTIPVNQSSHIVDLTSRNLTNGKYKARMTDGTNYSDYTYFEVLKTQVSCTINGNVANITWNSDGKAVGARLCIESGSPRAVVEFTDDEIEASSASVDFVTINKELGLPAIKGASGVFLKVYFKGDYGRVTNAYLPVSF